MASSRLPFMIISLLLVAACAPSGVVPGGPQSVPPSTSTSSAPPSPTRADEEPKAIRNDLKSGKLSRRLATGDVVVRVDYATTLKTAQWTTTATKPFRVTATAKLSGDGQQPKIYLSKLTVSLDVRDDTEQVESPLPLTDEAAIVPGFLLSSPATYGQEFFIPGLVPGSRSLTMRIRYELLLESLASSEATTKDYSRRTVTDIVVVPIAPE